MERHEIFLKLSSLIAEILEIDESSISEQSTYSDLGADSFDLLELMTAVEEEFTLTLDEESIASIQTVGQMLDLIEKAQ